MNKIVVCDDIFLDSDELLFHNETNKNLEESNLSLINSYFPGTEDELINIITENGDLDKLKFLKTIDPYYLFRIDIASHAALNGHIHILEWLKSEFELNVNICSDCPFNNKTANSAVLHGQLEVFKWLISNRCLIDKDIILHAIKGDHLDIVKYIRINEHFRMWHSSTYMKEAARNGRLEIIKYLHSEGVPLDRNLCFYTVRSGNIELIEWLIEKGCIVDEHLIISAVIRGNLKIVKWLRSLNPPCMLSKHAFFMAAEYNRLEILIYLKEQGLTPDTMDTLNMAVSTNHLEVFHWLRNEGYDINPIKCIEHVMSTIDPELPNFFIEDPNFTVSKNMCINSAGNGDLRIFEWLKNQNYSIEIDEIMCNIAGSNGHFKLFKWLRSEGCSWSENTTKAIAINGHLDILKWAIDEGCPYNLQDLYDASVKCKNQSIGDWLIEKFQ